MNINLINKLNNNKIIPIIRDVKPKEALDIARAIYDGGIDLVEITIENPRVLDAINELSNEMLICAGGIITSLQAQAAIDAGAKIISSPIFQKNLVKISKDRQVPLIAGTTTANEAYQAWQARVPLVKIYPVTALGGADYIKNLLRPMPFLKIIPQGAVELKQVNDYINAGATAVGIGRNLIYNKTCSEITNEIKKFKEGLI